MRKLGIPTVIDRIVQQAIAQVLQPMYEATFCKASCGYRVGRNAQQAMESVKEYVEKGYRYVVEVDLSKYFDTLNHDLLLNILRRRIKAKRLIELIKKFLKSGVMDNGVIVKTEEGSPLLANDILLKIFRANKKGSYYTSTKLADSCLLLCPLDKPL